MIRAAGLGNLASLGVHELRRELVELRSRLVPSSASPAASVQTVAAKLGTTPNLTRGEVAVFLGVSSKKVQRMEAAGTLQRCPNLGTLVRYSSRDVLRLASAHRKER